MGDIRFPRLEKRRVGGTRDRMELAYPPPQSPSGKIYHYSPNLDAAPRLFLIGEAPEPRDIAPENRYRIRREPGPGATVCPYSGYIGPDDEFVYSGDIEAITKQLAWEVAADFQDWARDLARDFNRGMPRGGLIDIHMEVKTSPRPRPVTIREDLLRNLECEICQRPYGVYAIALFCPDCGGPNFVLHFRREVALVREQIALAREQDAAGRAEMAYRLMGNAHEDVLTAFETTMKTLYRQLIRRHLPQEAPTLCGKKAIGNAFQNTERTREKFGRLGIDPFMALSADNLACLEMNIQKRHVIGHNLAIADETYAALTQAEQPGETVALIGDEVTRFADICLTVITDMEEHLLLSSEEGL